MKSAAIVLFIVSAVLFGGTCKYFLDVKRPGVYPPKQLLKKRAAVLAGFGSVFFVTAVLLSYFL
jgi:hypothetical protein